MILVFKLLGRLSGRALAVLILASVIQPCQAQTQSALVPPTGITPPTLSQQLTIGLPPINVCPKGYMASRAALQNLHLAVCVVPPEEENRCAAQAGAYECGLDGNECCRSTQDNPCFPGAYACSDPASPGSGARTACCMTR